MSRLLPLPRRLPICFAITMGWGPNVNNVLGLSIFRDIPAESTGLDGWMAGYGKSNAD